MPKILILGGMKKGTKFQIQQKNICNPLKNNKLQIEVKNNLDNSELSKSSSPKEIENVEILEMDELYSFIKKTQ